MISPDVYGVGLRDSSHHTRINKSINQSEISGVFSVSLLCSVDEIVEIYHRLHECGCDGFEGISRRKRNQQHSVIFNNSFALGAHNFDFVVGCILMLKLLVTESFAAYDAVRKHLKDDYRYVLDERSLDSGDFHNTTKSQVLYNSTI